MSGFNKIVPEIIQSSIWNEPAEVRIVWITMLATKDQDGYVRGDARTIARMANVSTEAAEDAIRRFQEPDHNSHTPTEEGRRIRKADGGFVVINSDIYREVGMNEVQRELWREKKRQQRAKKTIVQDMSKTVPKNVLETHVSVSVSDIDLLDMGVQGEKVEKPKTFKQWTREEFKAECITKSEEILEEVDGVAFYQYWIEQNTKGKMRFQLNQTWDTALRMHTWRRNKEEREARKAFK